MESPLPISPSEIWSFAVHSLWRYGKKGPILEKLLNVSSTEKKGYYIHDNKSKKKYTTFSKWSLARKQEVNPELKGPDVGNKAVNCFRDGRWIKLEDLLKT